MNADPVGYVVVTWNQASHQPDLNSGWASLHADPAGAAEERDDLRADTASVGRGERHDVCVVTKYLCGPFWARGDLPLSPNMGTLVADLIVDQNLRCRRAVSEFDSKAAQMRFLTAFGTQLFRRHGRDPQPRLLILEEADESLPQGVRAEQARCV